MSDPILVAAITLGFSGVGKSSLLHRFDTNVFNPAIQNTVGGDTFFIIRPVKVRTNKQETVELTIKYMMVDSAGQERFDAITSTYMRKRDVVLLCYDTTDLYSLFDLERYMDDLLKYAPNAVFIGVGCKQDLWDRNRSEPTHRSSGPPDIDDDSDSSSSSSASVQDPTRRTRHVWSSHAADDPTDSADIADTAKEDVGVKVQRPEPTAWAEENLERKQQKQPRKPGEPWRKSKEKTAYFDYWIGRFREKRTNQETALAFPHGIRIPDGLAEDFFMNYMRNRTKYTFPRVTTQIVTSAKTGHNVTELHSQIIPDAMRDELLRRHAGGGSRKKQNIVVRQRSDDGHAYKMRADKKGCAC